MKIDIDYLEKILILINEKHQDSVLTLKDLSKMKNGSIDTYEFYLKETEYYKQLKEKTETLIRDLKKWEY